MFPTRAVKKVRRHSPWTKVQQEQQQREQQDILNLPHTVLLTYNPNELKLYSVAYNAFYLIG